MSVPTTADKKAEINKLRSFITPSSNSGVYDIILSFRRLDIRKKFTDHLYLALEREGFQTFRRDDEIRRGKNIKLELWKAISNSSMSVILLSKNYANSVTCLCEIQTILEHRKKSSDHLVLPVFYEVDPREIKEQAKNLVFGKKKVIVEEVRRWSAALKEVASMAGMVSQNLSDGYEAKFIEEIVSVLKWKLAGNQELDKSMKILKGKVKYWSAQVDYINKQITSVEHRPWKRQKTEVEVWLTDVHQLKDNVQQLKDNVQRLEEISLEKLEETPSDPQELEDFNSDPMEVPSTLSHHFSILHVLDLSYTDIKSLPQSISRLVALQKLFLRNCELLMELPPEIGELTNLEVLDLEGTEILFLPKEIAKLVNLTCLKVSFYGYASQTVQTVIPRGVLSNLSRLIELIIDVSPYGEWWDVEVEAVIDDLRSLKQLATLKLYLPTTILLEELKCMFPGLSNFRFTVGRHEEHFISRLPHDVEEEFNNLEKGLKYINGSHIPNEITKEFKPNAFFLQRQWTAKSLSDFGHENIDEVKFCLVMECNEFRTIIDSEQFYQGKDGIVLGSLENLIIRYMKNMESIWKGPVGKGSLSNLKSLALHTCPILTTLFTVDMLGNLSNVEELIVEDCPKIENLVSLKSSGSKSDLFLPSLKKISLIDVPELVSISGDLWIAPKLERMVILYCPKLEKLSTAEVSSTELKVIKGEKEWWDALKWYESDVSTKREDYLARHFIPLRRDGDLIAQLTKD